MRDTYLPASSCKNPKTLVCLGVLSMCGRKLEAAASKVSASITAIATPIPIVTVLACHQALGISQKLKSNIAGSWNFEIETELCAVLLVREAFLGPLSETRWR